MVFSNYEVTFSRHALYVLKTLNYLDSREFVCSIMQSTPHKHWMLCATDDRQDGFQGATLDLATDRLGTQAERLGDLMDGVDRLLPQV